MAEDLFSKALENPDQELDLKLKDDVKVEGNNSINKGEETKEAHEQEEVLNEKDNGEDKTIKAEEQDVIVEEKDVIAEKQDVKAEEQNVKAEEQNVKAEGDDKEQKEVIDPTTSDMKKLDDGDRSDSEQKTSDFNTSEIQSEDGISNKIDTKDITSEVSETGITSYTSENSSSDTDSDSSGDDDDNAKNILEDQDSDLDEPSNTEPIRSKNELVDDKMADLPDDYKIDEKANIMSIGKIKSLIDDNFIITAELSGEKRVLEEGSIFCLEDKTPLGVLREVFGPLQSPFYRVGITSNFKKEKNLKDFIDHSVFIVLKDVHWVDTFELRKIKGTDASNMFDEELPEEEQEFSDDEKEAMFKKQKKQKKRGPSEKNNKPNQNVKKPKNDTSFNIATMKVPIGMSKSHGYTSRSSREGRNNDSNAASEGQNAVQRQTSSSSNPTAKNASNQAKRQPQTLMSNQQNPSYFVSPMQQNIQTSMAGSPPTQQHINYPNMANNQFLPGQFPPPPTAMFKYPQPMGYPGMNPMTAMPQNSMTPPPIYRNANMYPSPQQPFQIAPGQQIIMPPMPGQHLPVQGQPMMGHPLPNQTQFQNPHIGQQAYQLHQILMQQQQQQQQPPQQHMPPQNMPSNSIPHYNFENGRSPSNEPGYPEPKLFK